MVDLNLSIFILFFKTTLKNQVIFFLKKQNYICLLVIFVNFTLTYIMTNRKIYESARKLKCKTREIPIYGIRVKS